jgi:hypothetical protein
METLLLRCRYDRHMLQASETEDRLPFPCSTHVRHLHHVSNKSRRLNQYRDEHRDGPRNHTTSPADVLPIPANGRRSLAMASIPVSPYPRHSGLRCRSVYRTLELSYAQATCQLQALKSLPDTLARIYRHCKRDSCVRKLTGWKIDDLACGCVFIHQN